MPRHGAGDGGTPIAALGDVARIPEALHQFRPDSRDVVRVPPGDSRFAGESVAGDGWDDDVEGIGGVASVCSWVRKWADDLDEFEDGARPAVRHDERQRVRTFGAHPDEVDVDPVNGGYVLR